MFIARDDLVPARVGRSRCVGVNCSDRRDLDRTGLVAAQTCPDQAVTLIDESEVPPRAVLFIETDHRSVGSLVGGTPGGREQHEGQHAFGFGFDRFEAIHDDPWDAVLDQHRVAVVLGRLGVHHRGALTLRYVDGLPVADVAVVLGRSVHATEALLGRARLAFRSLYEASDR